MGSISQVDSYDSHGRYSRYGGRFPDSIHTILMVDLLDTVVDFPSRFIRFSESIRTMWGSISRFDSYDFSVRFLGYGGRFHVIHTILMVDLWEIVVDFMIRFSRIWNSI